MNVATKSVRPRQRLALRVTAESAVAVIGIALVVGALGADQTWFDRHFMPVFFLSHRTQVLAETLARVAIGALGVSFALVARPLIGRLVARASVGALVAATARVTLAVVLALGASELVLRSTFWRAIEEPPPDEEPLRQPDQRLGWTFVPARTGRATVGGRVIEYAFDRGGYRVRRTDQPVDPERPTIVFTGESIVAGYGLSWDESIPAQVEALLGTQSANLAVFGFANDQAYLRLLAELPRLRRPAAVVSIFIPALFNRNFGDDRPHLGPGLIWLPAAHRWRLAALLKWLVPYRSDEAVERCIAVTGAVLRATVDLARARGAEPLIVMPQFGPESATEEMLRRRILDEPGLPYVRVELDPSWHLPGDLHPDSRAAQAIAIAVAARLRER